MIKQSLAVVNTISERSHFKISKNNNKIPFNQTKISCFCFGIFNLIWTWMRKLLIRNVSNENRESKLSSDKISEAHLKIVSFFNLLIKLMRVKKLLKSKTKFRGLEALTKREINLVNDVTYLHDYKSTSSFSLYFIRYKTIRKILSYCRKFIKKYLQKPLEFMRFIISNNSI